MALVPAHYWKPRTRCRAHANGAAPADREPTCTSRAAST